MAVLETILLGKFYPTSEGRVHALRGISLSLEEGETLAVVGPKRAGKTTLLNLLAGLDRQTRGAIYVKGADLGNLPRWRLNEVRAQQVGFVTAWPHLLPERTVLENVAWPLRYLPKAQQKGGRERALGLLSRVGLAGRAGARPQELTIEEQQRAAIARAFASGPALVLADEPTAHLDPLTAREIMLLLREMTLETRATLVVATEDAELVAFADRTLSLPEEGIGREPVRGAVAVEEAPSAGQVLSDIYSSELQPLTRPLAPLFNLVIRPALYTLAVALLITYLCFFGLALASRGQAEMPPQIWRTAGWALSETTQYLSKAVRGDMGIVRETGYYYYWGHAPATPVRDVVADGVKRSLPLLGLSLVLAALIGAPLGIGAALARRSRLSLGFIALAVAGVSIPSFFLAFLLQLGEIRFYRATGIQLVPLGGFGWDRRMILPALVLAARPIAQVARVSFVALAEVLGADYIRTARAKGLAEVAVLTRHALKNAAVPILTALATSLRFALSSLPVVETIFSWPGLGQKLLTAMSFYQVELAAGLTLVLGLFFTVVNVLLENVNRLVDPRMDGERTRLGPQRSWFDLVQGTWQSLVDLPLRLRGLWKGRPALLRPLQRLQDGRQSRPEPTRAEQERDAAIRRERRRAWARHTFGSLPFMLGATIILALVLVCIFGPSWAPHDPFEGIATRTVNGNVISPPFPPSSEFLLGTDQQGRDILSLLLVGARRTLSIAFFAVLARIVAGALLGCLAGWFAGSLLDRALMSAVEVLAAFPALLLAMVVIYALGIKQGIWVFVAGLCAVGWGEAAQFVRGQVITIREKEYVEGALAVGLGDMQVLLRQALPNLFPSLVVLAFLEMGGVMMLLGELGFIGLFIGGGVRTTTSTDTAVVFFDTPEWGVMLSNTWRSFRTHPWATLYPALAFTISIVGFNFFGEGLRRLTERLTVNLNRVFSRYTIGAAVGVALLATAAAEGAGPWGRYKAMAGSFDEARAMADVQALAGPEMEGRRTGTPALDRAADYIAGQFEACGLLPGGEVVGPRYTYFHTEKEDYHDLSGPPELALETWQGAQMGPFAYGQDFIEYYGTHLQQGAGQGEVVYAAPGLRGSTYGLDAPAWAAPLAGSVILADQLTSAIANTPAQAVLLINPDATPGRRHLQTEKVGTWAHKDTPYLIVSEEVAERILAVRGYSLQDLRERQQALSVNDGFTVETGVSARVNVPMQAQQDVPTRNVLALFPGTDQQLDNQAVFVVAHYDGLGSWHDGTLYPGANDNASGVAVMLEAARVLKESGFKPKRTIFFVAWSGAERRQELDLAKMLSARVGFVEAYRISTVVEVRGVGAGTGSGLVLDEASSGRATDVFREAARREGVSASTRGRTLHSSPIYPGYGSNYIPTPGKPRLPYIALSWDGSDATEHLPTDTVDSIDPGKLGQTGRVLTLALMRMTGETRY